MREWQFYNEHQSRARENQKEESGEGMSKINIGDKVKDKVTGFKGIVVSMSKHLYGCDRIGVQPEVGPDGKIPDCGWFDIDAAELIEAGAVKGHTEEPVETKRGGPTLPGQIPTRSNPR